MLGNDAMQPLIELLGSKVAPPSKRRYARRKSVGEFTAGLGQQGGAKHVPVVGMLKRPRAAFRNWFSGVADLFQRQARAWDVAP